MLRKLLSNINTNITIILRFPWFVEHKIKRHDLVIALRMRLGHIPMNKFEFMMGKVDSEL